MYVIEYLTLYRLLFFVLPVKLWRSVKREPLDKYYFIDASPQASFGSRLLGRVSHHLLIQPLKFRLVDIHDETGLLIRLRIVNRDLAEIRGRAMSEPILSEVMQGANNDELKTFLTKEVLKGSLADRTAIGQAMFLIEICAWSARRAGQEKRVRLFLGCRPWLGLLKSYGIRAGVTFVPWKSWPRLRDLPQSALSPTAFFGLQAARNRLFHLRFFGQKMAQRNALSKHFETKGRLKLALEFSGHLNLDRPECHSDFFYWQQSSLPGSDVLVVSRLPQDPIDEEKAAALSKHGMSAIALHPLATTLPRVPLFAYWPRAAREQNVVGLSSSVRNTPEGRWIKRRVQDYFANEEYWRELFRQENIRLFVIWHRFDSSHCPIIGAMRSLGGITAVYQRAFQVEPTPEIAVNTDVMFGYSNADAEVERRSGSRIRYYVATGYLGDHRFALLKGPAGDLRSRLKQNGAEFIIAFFDENSAPDERWQTGQRFQADNYAFLLEKVLSEPWLGLVMKPKVPSTLRKRLGPVSSLLEAALRSGRCYIYDSGPVQSSYPPAAAALAADVAIHGHLCAATAGLESALAGVRTLLLDREGWHVSPMYRLGIGRVVFKNWEELWNALIEYRRFRDQPAGFGDWSTMLQEFDPFRDGRAAERMGTYLHWLLDDLKAGLSRDAAMANAAERYSELWGQDKITAVGYGASFETEVRMSEKEITL